MTVYTEPTPNPNAMKFKADKQIFSGDDSYSVTPGQLSEFSILNELIQLKNVDNVFGYQFFITINKNEAIEWAEIIPQVKAIMAEHGY